ncbi:MAG: hypothetical protein ACRC0X_00940 [Brevinema sp.]
MMSVISVFLFLPIVIFGQEPLNNQVFVKYSNNLQYLTNPLSAFVYQRNLIDQKEFITLKTNIMNFSNDQGNFHLNFIFYRDRITLKQTVDIIIKISSAILITPYDGFDQKLEMIITDQYYTYLWRKDFQFNLREAFLEIDRQSQMHLLLRSTISDDNFTTIDSLFDEGNSILFFFKGLQGRFEFQFSQEIVLFYREFFNYKQKIYRN